MANFTSDLDNVFVLEAESASSSRCLRIIKRWRVVDLVGEEASITRCPRLVAKDYVSFVLELSVSYRLEDTVSNS